MGQPWVMKVPLLGMWLVACGGVVYVPTPAPTYPKLAVEAYHCSAGDVVIRITSTVKPELVEIREPDGTTIRAQCALVLIP